MRHVVSIRTVSITRAAAFLLIENGRYCSTEQPAENLRGYRNHLPIVAHRILAISTALEYPPHCAKTFNEGGAYQ